MKTVTINTNIITKHNSTLANHAAAKPAILEIRQEQDTNIL